MRGSQVGSMKHTHKEIVHNRMEGNSFGNASSDFSGLSELKNFAAAGNNVKDYDGPELVVFLQEDHQKLVKDICIDRGVSSTNHNGILSFFDLDMKRNSDSNVGTTGTELSSSNESEFAFQHPCTNDGMKQHGFRNLLIEGEVELDSGDKNSIDHPRKMTSETLREVFNKETEFSRSFKNWQINSFLGTTGSRVELPHCSSDCQTFPTATTSMFLPERGNSQSVTGSGKWIDPQANYQGETSSCAVGSYNVPATKSEGAYHQSNDSISSTHSFAFPILTSEWTGSPVRMLEAERRQSRRKQLWRKIRFPCCRS